MLPDIRTKDEGCAIPPFDVVPSDVEGFMDALRAFQSPFHDCCARSEPRAPFFDYMVGPLRARERQSIEPMALAIAGGNIRGMQRFISDDPWDEAQMRWHDHHLVAEALGAPNGVVMFAETGFVTKGQESAGVARQYGGALGKGENCQGGVCAAQASRPGYALVAKRWFMPAAWLSEASAERRATCRVPQERALHSTPQLAAAMWQALAHEGGVPCTSVVADCFQGNSPDFLDAVDAWVGVTACVAIPAETRGWLQAPQTAAKTYRQKGEERATRGVVAPEHAPYTVAAVATHLPAASWYRRTVSAGTKGPMAYECARQRVTLGQDGLPDRPVWLVITRTLGAEPSSASSLSNAPVSTPLRLFVW